MDETSLKKLTTEEKVTILEKEIARVEGRIGEFLGLLVSHYPQGLTRTEIKALLAVNNNQSFVSLYRNGNIFIDRKALLRCSTRKSLLHRNPALTRRTMLPLGKCLVRCSTRQGEFQTG